MSKAPSLYSFADTDELAPYLRKYVLAAQNAAISHHHSFRVAVSGGSLPKTLAKALLAHGDGSGDDTVRWAQWDVFFADERLVPFDDADSNYKLLRDELLDKIPGGAGAPTVHPIDLAQLADSQELADAYEQELVRTFAAKDSVKLPIFDLLLLGCGPDGHTCSLFPAHPLLRETTGWILPIDDSPKPPPRRITLALPVVQAAARIAFVATGDGKRDILRQIFESDDDDNALPCALVNKAGEKVAWFTDAAATHGMSYPRRGSL